MTHENRLELNGTQLYIATTEAVGSTISMIVTKETLGECGIFKPTVIIDRNCPTIADNVKKAGLNSIPVVLVCRPDEYTGGNLVFGQRTITVQIPNNQPNYWYKFPTEKYENVLTANFSQTVKNGRQVDLPLLTQPANYSLGIDAIGFQNHDPKIDISNALIPLGQTGMPIFPHKKEGVLLFFLSDSGMIYVRPADMPVGWRDMFVGGRIIDQKLALASYTYRPDVAPALLQWIGDQSEHQQLLTFNQLVGRLNSLPKYSGMAVDVNTETRIGHLLFSKTEVRALSDNNSIAFTFYSLDLKKMTFWFKKGLLNIETLKTCFDTETGIENLGRLALIATKEDEKLIIKAVVERTDVAAKTGWRTFNQRQDGYQFSLTSGQFSEIDNILSVFPVLSALALNIEAPKQEPSAEEKPDVPKSIPQPRFRDPLPMPIRNATDLLAQGRGYSSKELDAIIEANFDRNPKRPKSRFERYRRNKSQK